MGWTVKGWFHLSRAVRTIAVAISVSVSVLGQVGCSEAGGQMRAIIIGIDGYRHIKPLKGGAADAREIEATLRASGAADLKLLLDEEVDRATILREFESLLARSKPDDTVFIS